MSEERTYKKWSARDVKKCIAVPSDLDNKYSRGVLGVITGSAQYPGAAVLSTSAASATLARIAASAAFIHNTAALKASDGGPITSTQILEYIPRTIKQFI